MAQEPLANQQQQQQLQHSRSNSYNTIAHSSSIPGDPQAPTLKRNHGLSNIFTMDNVFLPRNVPDDASVGKMDEVDRELKEFKRFCFMAKPLENRPKVTVKVELKDLTLKKPYLRTPQQNT